MRIMKIACIMETKLSVKSKMIKKRGKWRKIGQRVAMSQVFYMDSRGTADDNFLMRCYKLRVQTSLTGHIQRSC